MTNWNGTLAKSCKNCEDGTKPMGETPDCIVCILGTPFDNFPKWKPKKGEANESL